MSIAQRSWSASWIWWRRESGPCAASATFRTVFDSPHASAARIVCTADSRYTLWLNGERLPSGPARGMAAHPLYDTHEVQLARGANTLAALVEFNSDTAVFQPVHPGLLCEVECAGTILTASGPSWRARFAEESTYLKGVLAPEHFDARLEPDGWTAPGFDDAAWPSAVVVDGSGLAAPSACRARPIPPLTLTRLLPVRLLDAGLCHDPQAPDPAAERDVAGSLMRSEFAPFPAGATGAELVPGSRWIDQPLRVHLEPKRSAFLVLDFGRETLACLETAVLGRAGVALDVGFGELIHDGRVGVRWQNMDSAHRILLRDGLTRHRTHRPVGFRYLLCRIANGSDAPADVTVQSLAAWETVYPVQPVGAWRSSDAVLDQVHRLSENTVALCMMDAFMDCPWREQAQWLGDLHLEALVAYTCFGDRALARKAVLEFAESADPEGWVPGVAPSAGRFNLPTWGMRYPVIARDYLLHSGDTTVLAAVHRASIDQIRWLARFERADGLLEDVPGWNFVDWSPLTNGANEAAMLGWHLQAIEATADLALAVGDGAGHADLVERAARLRASLASAYWSEERGAFLSYRADSRTRPRGVSARLIGQHENFLFATLGIGSPAQRASALDAMRGPTGRYLPFLGDNRAMTKQGNVGHELESAVHQIATPFWSYFAVEALFESGRTQAALDYMRHAWGFILEHGDMTCWEGWDRHASLCHGWSAAPAQLLPAYALGIRPLTPGFAEFAFKPHPGDLRHARGSIPTPHGAIEASWERSGSAFTCRLNVPAGTRARVDLGRLPIAVSSVQADGRDARREDLILDAGAHRIVIDGRCDETQTAIR